MYPDTSGAKKAMSHRAGIIGLFALPGLFLGGCAPDAGQQTDDVEAEAAEAPPTERPTTTAFGEWDINQDQALQRDEFISWSGDEGVFDDWIGDQGFDLETFRGDLREAWDMDGDGNIIESEWQAGTQSLFGENPQIGNFSDWDVDGDGQISEEEMAAADERINIREQLDQNGDGTIDRQEVGDFFFEAFDQNDDGQLDTTEWETGRSTWFGDGMGM